VKISDLNGVVDPRVAGAGAAPESAGAPGRTAAAAQGGDAVEVSETARLLAGLARVNVDEVRPQRVAALRQAIASGTYQVDPAAVARAFLTEVAGHLLG
jgi:flagellar biosynthesis anti-sigma factor FlgM